MSWTQSFRKTFRVLSLRRVIEVGAMTMAVITLGCTGEGSPAGGVADPTRLACGAGKSFAGIEDVAPQGRFDGVSATVAATRSFAGLVDQEHVSAVVGVGDGTRLYIAVSLGTFVNGRRLVFAYEYGKPGDFAYLPLTLIRPISPGGEHSLAVRRVQGASRAVEIDGQRVAQPVALPQSGKGLPYPHVFLSSTNQGVPCDNEGGFVFSQVSVLRHGKHSWGTFPRRSQVRASPGYRIRLISSLRFSAESD